MKNAADDMCISNRELKGKLVDELYHSAMARTGISNRELKGPSPLSCYKLGAHSRISNRELKGLSASASPCMSHQFASQIEN